MNKPWIGWVLTLCLSFWGCSDGSGCPNGVCECQGSSCVCPSSGDCLLNCAAGCNLQCAGSGDCRFSCGSTCSTSCTGSGHCNLDVGPSATVSCTGSGGCDVVCHGNCTVRCPGSGKCSAVCAPETPGCVIDMTQCSGTVNRCSSGVFLCHANC